MTTILARRDDAKKSWDLAWDSKVSPEGNHPEKVKLINGQFYLGVAGYARHSDVLHYADVPDIHPAEFEDPGFDARGYLITQVIPAWLRILKDVHGFDPDTNDDWPKGSALIYIAGRVFTTDSIFAVTEHLESTGIGSGSDYALGALAAGKSVEKAMQIACDLDPGTGGDLHVLKGLK